MQHVQLHTIAAQCRRPIQKRVDLKVHALLVDRVEDLPSAIGGAKAAAKRPGVLVLVGFGPDVEGDEVSHHVAATARRPGRPPRTRVALQAPFRAPRLRAPHQETRTHSPPHGTHARSPTHSLTRITLSRHKMIHQRSMSAESGAPPFLNLPSDLAKPQAAMISSATARSCAPSGAPATTSAAAEVPGSSIPTVP